MDQHPLLRRGVLYAQTVHMDQALSLLQAGVANLASYLAAHVLLCLVPAFFVAGAMAALVPRASITRWLGREAPVHVAYPAAAAAGAMLAVCSCTVVPLFAGIYRRGAGLGPAMTFLFMAPAANILAISYTGAVLGLDLAGARLVLALVFGLGIGLLMATLFNAQEAQRTKGGLDSSETAERPGYRVFVVLVALLLAGTLKVEFLAATWWQFPVSWPALLDLQAGLNVLAPVDAARGMEGVTLHGVVLVLLLGVLAPLGVRGLGHVDEGFRPSTWWALGLVVLTVVLAAFQVAMTADGVVVGFTGRTAAVIALLGGLVAVARRHPAADLQAWWWESWRFVRQVFPWLLVGVFLVGMARELVRPEWMRALAGENTLLANLAGVAFGVFMYFPTLVEVPVAQMFLHLGMHKGPLLAYLMADPELSLQSVLMTSKVIGKARVATYVGLVVVFSTVSGYAYGSWVDGTPVVLVLLAMTSVVAALLLMLWLVARRTPLALPKEQRHA